MAAGEDFAHKIIEISQERGYVLKIPPTVVQELAFPSEQDRPEAFLALKASQEMIGWGLVPFSLVPVEHAITEPFSRKLMIKGLLPETEFNDGLILAEAALGHIPVLATADHHLLDIESTSLRVQLEDTDLPSVAVAHPRAILRALC